jgi:hypothetical protein
LDKKTIYIVVAVIVVILIVGVAGVMLLNNNGNGGTTNPTATPTPAPSVPVANATDLSFSVNQTTSGVVVSYTYTCKGLNAVDEKVRVDMCLTEGTYSYIIDLGTQKSYASTNGGSTWTATTFADDCTNYVTPFHNIVTKIIANGNANDFSFTESGTTNDVFCIAVNPTIADSVFATS